MNQSDVFANLIGAMFGELYTPEVSFEHNFELREDLQKGWTVPLEPVGQLNVFTPVSFEAISFFFSTGSCSTICITELKMSLYWTTF